MLHAPFSLTGNQLSTRSLFHANAIIEQSLWWGGPTRELIADTKGSAASVALTIGSARAAQVASYFLFPIFYPLIFPLPEPSPYLRQPGWAAQAVLPIGRFEEIHDSGGHREPLGSRETGGEDT